MCDIWGVCFVVPCTACTARRAATLYGFLFLRLRRKKNTTDICSKTATDCAFFKKKK